VTAIVDLVRAAVRRVRTRPRLAGGRLHAAELGLDPRHLLALLAHAALDGADAGADPLIDLRFLLPDQTLHPVLGGASGRHEDDRRNHCQSQYSAHEILQFLSDGSLQPRFYRAASLQRLSQRWKRA
jgi:hypothetical protein